MKRIVIVFSILYIAACAFAADPKRDVLIWPDKNAVEAAVVLCDKDADEEVVHLIAISDSQLIKARFAVTKRGNGILSLPGLVIRVYDRHDDGVVFRGGLLLCEWRREPPYSYADLVVSGIAERYDEKSEKKIADVSIRAVFRYSSAERRFFPISCSPEIDFWSSKE